MDNPIVKFKDGAFELDVQVMPEQDTVWLTQAQMVALFDRERTVITKHINNIFKEKELDEKSNVQFLHIPNSDKPVKFYNLDVIISVGYRVKSQRGIQFRKWATGVLKQYLIDGYAINEKRMAAMNKVIQIQSGIIAGVVGIGTEDVLKVVNEYSKALQLLDDYDHQAVPAPEGTAGSYPLTYDECTRLIRSMSFNKDSAIFGTEKEPGKLEGILSAIHQSAFGQDAYPSLEEKAANLLYFLIKDHPFNDGCKRIGAALFLYFLDKNKALYRNRQPVISESALVAMTLLIAESDPQEKDIMIRVIMNFLEW